MSVLRISLFALVMASAVVVGLLLDPAGAASGCSGSTLTSATLAPCSGAPGSAARVTVTSTASASAVSFSQRARTHDTSFGAGLSLNSGSAAAGNAVYSLTIPPQLCNTGGGGWKATLFAGSVSVGLLGIFTPRCPPPPTQAPTPTPTPRGGGGARGK